MREEIQQLNCKGFPAPQEQTIADEILMLTKDQVENEHLNEWQHWESNLKEETSLAEVAQPISEIITTQVLQIPLTYVITKITITISLCMVIFLLDQQMRRNMF